MKQTQNTQVISEAKRQAKFLAFAAEYMLKELASNGVWAEIARSVFIENNNDGVAYFAVRVVASRCVTAVIVPIKHSDDAVIINHVSMVTENDPQAANWTDCPPSILEVLDPTDNPAALAWRATCASHPWDYSIEITRRPDGNRDIRVVLSTAAASFVVAEEVAVPSSEFDAVYDRIVVNFPMASIRPV